MFQKESQLTNQIKLNDIKQALKDSRFRETLPESMTDEVQKFLSNPGCACNVPLYRKILQICPQQVKDYFPGKLYESPQEEAIKLSKNHWSVISCGINELEDRLRKLPPGRKQLAMARYDDQITVIVNELDIIV